MDSFGARLVVSRGTDFLPLTKRSDGLKGTRKMAPRWRPVTGPAAPGSRRPLKLSPSRTWSLLAASRAELIAERCFPGKQLSAKLAQLLGPRLLLRVVRRLVPLAAF